jgi:PhnB protein
MTEEARTGMAPLLCAEDVILAAEFYRRAFGARETGRDRRAEKVVRLEMELAGVRFVIAEESWDVGLRAVRERYGSPVQLTLRVDDCDQAMRRAVDSGARQLKSPEGASADERVGVLRDPFGHVWHLVSRREDLIRTGVKRRAAAAMNARRTEPPLNPDSSPD